MKDIKEEAVTYYETFLQGQSADDGDVTRAYLEDVLDYRCSNADAALLVAPVTADEIKDALFSMSANKAPGPDGFPMEFYKTAWSVVGKRNLLLLFSPSSYSGCCLVVLMLLSSRRC